MPSREQMQYRGKHTDRYNLNLLGQCACCRGSCGTSCKANTLSDVDIGQAKQLQLIIADCAISSMCPGNRWPTRCKIMVAAPDVSTDPEKTLATADNVVYKTVRPRHRATGTEEVSITHC
jgi:hypothetical protein